MIPTRLDRWLPPLAWANLVAVLIVAGLVLFVGDRWWAAAVPTYLPRLPWLGPAAVLLGLALWRRAWRPAAASAVAGAVVAGPLMGLRLGLGRAEGAASMRVATCNIQDAKPRLELVLRELKRVDPDVVVFQESSRPRPEFEAEWPNWHAHHEATFFAASRWPLEPVGLVESDSMRRWCAAAVRVRHPTRPFVLVNVHLATARHGLAPLRDRDTPIGTALERLEVHQALREGELYDLREFVEQFEGEPVVLAGDFNQPSDAKFLTAAFGDWTSAFDAAGRGYGYTAPCDSGRLWPPNCPWLRIDHVLVRPGEYGVAHAEIGRTAGSDHRLVAADLVWGS